MIYKFGTKTIFSMSKEISMKRLLSNLYTTVTLLHKKDLCTAVSPRHKDLM